MQKIVSVFRAKCEERIAELVQDTNVSDERLLSQGLHRHICSFVVQIEQKLADLEILAESCEARNKELGVTDGYRPLDVSRVSNFEFFVATFSLALLSFRYLAEARHGRYSASRRKLLPHHVIRC